jgi:O-antigen ligase
MQVLAIIVLILASLVNEMNPLIQKETYTNLINFAGLILIVSMLFLPDIQFGSKIPAFQFVDFFLPLLLILIFLHRSKLQWNRYYWILIAFCIYIPITSAVNGRITVLNDYFEVYKFLKFFILIILFSCIDYRTFLQTLLKPIFVFLVIANLFHFYDLFGTNAFLLKYYNSGIQLKYFGLNSLKEPAVKRMIGLASNPNINSVIFSFFAICFLPLRFDRKKFYWFLSALLMVFLCQSRTGLLALGVILIAIAVFKLSDWNWKKWLIVLSSIVVVYVLGLALSTSFFKYSPYSANLLDGSAFMTNSARSRWESWNFLGKMILEQPVFGHSPNKEFFYSNNLYSENEYILMTWRYGLIGLLLYLLLLFQPLQVYIRSMKEVPVFKYGILIITLILVTALTNNPYTDRTINLLLACTIGLLIPMMPDTKKLSS